MEFPFIGRRFGAPFFKTLIFAVLTEKKHNKNSNKKGL
jgi:hypothetical protein